MNTFASTRRGFLLSTALLPLAACAATPSTRHTLSPRGDRLVALIQRTGRDNMTAPEAFALMGITNQGRDIPVRQLADDGADGRYVVNLVNIRKYHEFVFQRRQGDVLILHSADTAFRRLVSVRYARNGKPTVISDTAFAERDFQQQTAFWFDRIPGSQ